MLVDCRHFARTGLRIAAMVALAAACGVGVGAEPIDSNAELTSALRADLNAYLSAHRVDEHISTLSLSVSFHDTPRNINLAVGTTKYGGGLPATPYNLFEIGSNTKAFTAVAILQLEAMGALSINDTLGEWLPQYPAWRSITIRQLLNMTSGIPTYEDSPAFTAALTDPKYAFTPTELVAYVYPRFHKPGKQWEYSNTGYILAQMIVEKAARSGSFAAEMRRIITSAGLTNTFYESNFYPPSVTLRLVSGYFTNDGPDCKGYEPLLGTDMSGYGLSSAQAAGGIIGTPDDLAKWARALYESPALLAPKQRAELMSVVSIKTGQTIARTSAADSAAYGLGVTQAYDENLGTLWSYLGGTLGFRAIYDWFPSRDVVLAVAVNSYPANDHVSEVMASLAATLKKAGKL